MAVAVAGSAATLLSDYEKLRQDRIAMNKRKIEELGISAALQDVAATQEDSAPARKSRAPRAPKAEVDPDNLRRSGRERTTISYKEEDMYPDLPRASGPRGPRGPPRTVDEAQVEELRRKHGRDVGDNDGEGDEEAQTKARKAVDSGKGVRVQGGRVYDSKFGVTCHWCRQKTLEDHVTCTRSDCGKGRRLATTFCKMCLRNRHGEDVSLAAASGQWVCPGCRGSCGKGCVSCCNCGPCRKKLQLEPTRQVVNLAKQAGFSNVHDYLVHIVTGESCEEVAARKLGFAWGKWVGETEEDWLGRPAGGEGEAVEDDVGREEGRQGEVAAVGRGGRKATAKAAAKPRRCMAKRKAPSIEEEEEEGEEAGEPEAHTAKKGRGSSRRGSKVATPVAVLATPPCKQSDSDEEEDGEDSSEEEASASSEEAEEQVVAPAAPPALELPDGLVLSKKHRKQLELGLVTLDTLLAGMKAVKG